MRPHALGSFSCFGKASQCVKPYADDTALPVRPCNLPTKHERDQRKSISYPLSSIQRPPTPLQQDLPASAPSPQDVPASRRHSIPLATPGRPSARREYSQTLPRSRPRSFMLDPATQPIFFGIGGLPPPPSSRKRVPRYSSPHSHDGRRASAPHLAATQTSLSPSLVSVSEPTQSRVSLSESPAKTSFWGQFRRNRVPAFNVQLQFSSSTRTVQYQRSTASRQSGPLPPYSIHSDVLPAYSTMEKGQYNDEKTAFSSFYDPEHPCQSCLDD